MRVKDISVAIPYHGDRVKWVNQTILNVHNNNFIKEIVLTIDPCDDFDVKYLRKAVKNYPKVRIIENEKRLFVFRNKHKAVSECKSEWVALIDSDNIIGATFFGPILMNTLVNETIYCPEIGFPALHYEKFANVSIGFVDAVGLIGDPKYDMLVNTMNYMFHRETWLKALDEPIKSDYEPISADSAWINYNCMKAGMTLKVVRGSVYRHTVHDQSTYLLNQAAGIAQYANICKLMKGEYNDVKDFAGSREVQARKSRGVSPTPNLSAIRGSGRDVVQKECSDNYNRFDLLSD
jgi:hypothetical protein